MVLRIRDDMACNSVITVSLNALTVPCVAQSFPLMELCVHAHVLERII